jgi:TRAP-type mannitol/chloroaromatic compound transport system permease small subunit
MAAIVVWTSWPLILASWAQNEQSSNFGGLPQWPAKFLIPLAFAILFIQGVSELIKRIAIMRGELAESELGVGHPAGAPDSGHVQRSGGDANGESTR